MRHEEWKNMSLKDWGENYHAGLSFDYVALRDIKEGEEILIDYGEEWELAWQEHMANFEPPRKDYIPAFELNEMVDLKIRTVDERPYELDNVHLLCREAYMASSGLRGWLYHNKVTEWYQYEDVRCRVLERRNDDRYTAELIYVYEKNGQTLVDVEYEVGESPRILWDIPRDALYFEDTVFTRDHHQVWSFRHSMMIPDSIFPSVWRN
jgi:hypothetical protein